METSPPGDVQPNASTTDRHLETARDQLVNRAILTAAILGLPALGAAVFRALTVGVYSALYVNFAAVFALFATSLLGKDLSYGVRSGFLVFVFLALGSSSLLSYGLLGMGLSWFIIASVLAAMFLGTRAGVLTVCCGLLVSGIVAVGNRAGFVPPVDDVGIFALSTGNWIVANSIFGLITTLVVILMGRLHEELVGSNRLLDRMLRERADINEVLNREVREQKRTAAALRRSERQYRLLADNISDNIWVFGLRDNRFTFVSPSVERILGYTDREAMELTLPEILTPQAMKTIETTLAEELEREEQGTPPPDRSRVMELEQFRKDGSRVWTEVTASFLRDENGKPDRVLGITRDISERRKVEESLRQSEQKFSEAFHANASLMAITTVPEGRFIEVNETFLRALEFQREEVIGKTSLELGLWKDPGERTEILARVMQTGAVRNADIRTRTRSGKIRHGLFSAHTVTLGDRPCMLTVMSDITERKEAEAEKAALEQQLLQVRKLEAVGTLAGGVAHDFNNILAIIVGNAELALRGLPPDHPARSNLEELFRAALRGRDVVNQILTFSRRTEQSFRPASMGALVRDSIRMLRSTLPSTIEIREHLAAEEDIVLADASQITQILLNLGANAFHAMRGRGGVLEVGLCNPGPAAGAVDEAPPPLPGKSLLLTVRDSGHGMTPEVTERIFEPYFSTKAPGEGSGMGLAVVYGIVQKHGGVIQVDSRPGKGTEFRVILPLYEGKEEASPRIEGEAPRGGEEILLVDDEPALVALGAELLQELGYRATVTTSPEEALALFRKDPDRFAMVITDLTMPVMTGKGLARELTRIRPGVPVILTSGHARATAEEEGPAQGIRAVIHKPFVLNELATIIRRLLDEPAPGGRAG